MKTRKGTIWSVFVFGARMPQATLLPRQEICPLMWRHSIHKAGRQAHFIHKPSALVLWVISNWPRYTIAIILSVSHGTVWLVCIHQSSSVHTTHVTSGWLNFESVQQFILIPTGFYHEVHMQMWKYFLWAAKTNMDVLYPYGPKMYQYLVRRDMLERLYKGYHIVCRLWLLTTSWHQQT